MAPESVEAFVTILLFCAVAFLALANGANDNFKGVATLWGAGATTYKRALMFATAATLTGSLAAIVLGHALAAKFSGSGLVPAATLTSLPFLVSVVIGCAATVFLAARLGLPISTTHALVGALCGAGVMAAGLGRMQFGVLGKGVVAPLLVSPVLALGLTVAARWCTARVWRGEAVECVCVEDGLPLPQAGGAMAMTGAFPIVSTGTQAACAVHSPDSRRYPVLDGLHWFSAAAISFARGLNDTPKFVAMLLIASALALPVNYAYVGLLIAAGGLMGAARVARTMAKGITPMSTPEALTSNLVAAVLVMMASPLGLPVSTTHVTTGGILGIGLMRGEATDWRKVREILLSWVATLPLGAGLAALVYLGLRRLE